MAFIQRVLGRGCLDLVSVPIVLTHTIRIRMTRARLTVQGIYL